MAAILLVGFSLILFHSLAAATTTTLSWRTKYLAAISEVSQAGPYIGLITVYGPEERAFFGTKSFRPDPKHPSFRLAGRKYHVGTIYGKKVIYVRCGERLVNAALVTQQMLDMFNIIGIVHFGIAGNTNASMSIGDVTIPSQVANTGVWDWLKRNEKMPTDDVARLAFESYNVPKGEEGVIHNLLGSISYGTEELYSNLRGPNSPDPLFWAQVDRKWLHLASSNLEGIKLKQCWNVSLCLPEKPKLVVGLKASSANFFLDNPAYRNFLYKHFHISSHDEESSAVVMTCLSNSIPVIVIRGLSDLAGGQRGKNHVKVFGPLAAANAVKSVIQFVETFPEEMLR